MWNEAINSLAGGVLWVDASTDIDALVNGLDRRWRVARSVVETNASKTSLIDDIASNLDFPEWAGRNLDALYDLLTDLDWLPAHQHVVVVLERTPEAAKVAIDGWQQVVSVLVDAANWWHPDERTFVAILR